MPLRILLVHDRYAIRGGEDEVFDAQTRLLRSRGQHVDLYVDDNRRVAALGTLRTAVNTVWSRASYAALRRILRDGHYDVMDVHNTFPLISPSAYYAARAEGVPVVQTLHNYRLLCPRGDFYRDGQVCEDCLGKALPWPAVAHGCYRGSRAGTMAVAGMLSAHRLAGTWAGMVDVYVALTHFAKAKLVQGGLPAERVVVKPNWVDPDPGPGAHAGEYALYVGRLSQEKGITTLLEARSRLREPIPLLVAGDGPLASDVADAAGRSSSVRWLGRRPPEEIRQLMGDATFLVAPSECYETFGLVAAEAFARGTPVIAPDQGALAEVVEAGKTGLHFRAGNADNLACQVSRAWAMRDTLHRLGAEARLAFETRYTAERSYTQLLELYGLAREHALRRREQSAVRPLAVRR